MTRFGVSIGPVSVAKGRRKTMSSLSCVALGRIRESDEPVPRGKKVPRVTGESRPRKLAKSLVRYDDRTEFVGPVHL